MKWLSNDGKEFDIKFKYIRKPETSIEKKLREADEITNTIKRFIDTLDKRFADGYIISPTDIELDQYFKLHKFRGEIIGIMVGFDKEGNTGWSLVNTEPTEVPVYKNKRVPVLSADGTQKTEKFVDHKGVERVKKLFTTEKVDTGKKKLISDKFDLNTGIQLAYERAFGDKAGELPKSTKYQKMIKDFRRTY